MQKEEYLKELKTLEKKKLDILVELKKEIGIWPRSQKVKSLRKELLILKLSKEELLTTYSIHNIENSTLRNDNVSKVIKSFIERGIINDVTGYVEKKIIYNHYLEYCRDIEEKSIKYQTFCKNFPKYFSSNLVNSDRIQNRYNRKERIYVFTGITLKMN